MELFVGGHSAKPQLRTFASVHQPWTPLTISRHIFTDWRNGQTRDGKNWQGAEYEKVRSVRKGVDGHGLERKRSRNEMDHWWHTSLSARPHNHYTNTQSQHMHRQTQTQRNKDKHGHINIIASKVFSDQRRLLGQTSPPTTNNRKQYLPFLSHICWENVCLFVYLFVYMFLYISLFVYLFICVFVYFD